MKKMVLLILPLLLPLSLCRAEEPSPERARVALGGGAFLRYLRLNISRWEDPRGESLKDQDLAVSGGRLFACGPVGEGKVRWRLGGFLCWSANPADDDLDELQLGMVTGGLTSGLTWQPGILGVSADLNLGGSEILTEIKRRELEDDWDEYERRFTGLFYLEPLLSVGIQVSEIFLVRVQSGYNFLWGRGDQIGGFTAGIAVEVGKWL